MYISQTRLVQYASRAADGTVTQITPPVDRARFAGIVRTITEAMSYVPPAQRPTSDQWGGYALTYDLKGSIVLNPIGVRSDGTNHLIVLYDIWQDNNARLAGSPPDLQNSHEFAVPAGMSKADLRTLVINSVQDFVTRAGLNTWTGDQRDPAHIALATTGDPTGTYDKVRDLKDVVRNIDTATSNPSSAPLVSMTPK